MKRWLFTMTAGASFIICLATAALWLRGRDQFIFMTGDRLWWIISGRDGVEVATVEHWPGSERARWLTENSNEHIPTITFDGPETEWRRLGVDGDFAVVSTWLDVDGKPASLSRSLKDEPNGGPGRRSAPMRYVSLRPPYWMLIAVFGAVLLLHAGLWFRGLLQKRRRVAKGQCISCGYDLRATPERCPECGRIPAKLIEAAK